jgi:hypothetical protein
MKDRYIFTIVIWLAFLIVVVSVCVSRGNEYLDKCVKVKGKVVDQVVYSTRNGYKNLPQIGYPVGDTTFYYVDHHSSLATGSEPTILYLQFDPHAAMVYDFWFWIDTGFIVPVFILTLLLYKVVIILMERGSNKPEILPSNRPL